MTKENKTQPTAIAVKDFLETVSTKRQQESFLLIEIMQDITGKKAIMWGPSIIGFGTQHYKSEAGREGEIPLLSFSPRKSSLTIYFYEGFDRYGNELSHLGKHRISQGCLYINALDDVDREVLKIMLQSLYDTAVQPKQPTVSVDDYIESIPPNVRLKFDELRSLVRDTLPHAQEVLSYGILGYKIDDKRARVFISGWKDHLSIYPIPKNEPLRTLLTPYIKGKGTLWFPLSESLPKELIKKTIILLAS